MNSSDPACKPKSHVCITHELPCHPLSLLSSDLKKLPAAPKKTTPPSLTPTRKKGHCIPCRKVSGVTASYNLIVPSPSFTLTGGSPKQYTRLGDSGKSVTYNNCPTCSACLWVEAEAREGVKIVKMGAIDDQEFLDGLGKPEMEIYCRNLWGWEEGIGGAVRKEGGS